MAHAKLIRCAMFDWLEERITADQPLPTDEDICERFRFAKVESARSLLADLADEGRITIDWKSEPRRILLGRKPQSAFTPAKALASVVKPSERAKRHPASEQETVDKIRSILARGKAAVAPAHNHGEAQQVEDRPAPLTQQGAATPGTSQEAAAGSVAKQQDGPGKAARVVTPHRESTPPPRPEITGEEPGTTDTTTRLQLAATPEGRADTAEQASDRQVGASPAVAPTPIARAPAPPRAERRQLNVHFPGDRFVELEGLAAAAGMTPGAWARTIVIAALNGAEPEANFATGAKPFIRAAVIRAAARDDMPLHDFVTMLIERGFASYEADAAAERAA